MSFDTAGSPAFSFPLFFLHVEKGRAAPIDIGFAASLLGFQVIITTTCFIAFPKEGSSILSGTRIFSNPD